MDKKREWLLELKEFPLMYVSYSYFYTFVFNFYVKIKNYLYTTITVLQNSVVYILTFTSELYTVILFHVAI